MNVSFSNLGMEAQRVLEFAEELERTTESVAQSATVQNESVLNVSENMA